ncbi:HEAT repeat domain-containing protein [Methanoregula sp.]|uniref:HEAT repeat domain-containing protein n=1 Tax=Methanoregula sp. TaxID=2052170 RepID=UPI00356A917A
MKDQPRIILKDLVGRYGESLAHEPSRCEALLRDTCGSCGREIFVLVNAVRQHVPLDLLTPHRNLPHSLMKGFMMKRLQDELGLSDEAARWAVDTWAEALGLSDPKEQYEYTNAGSDPFSPQRIDEKKPVSDTSARSQWALDLESDNLETRLRAVDSLARAGDTECIRILIVALENSRWSVRSTAFDALVQISGVSVPVLVEALDDPHTPLVSRVILILASARNRDATEPLIGLLGHDATLDPLIIFALGEIGDSRATSPLSKCLASPDQNISLAVVGALRKISGT